MRVKRETGRRPPKVLEPEPSWIYMKLSGEFWRTNRGPTSSAAYCDIFTRQSLCHVVSPAESESSDLLRNTCVLTNHLSITFDQSDQQKRELEPLKELKVFIERSLQCRSFSEIKSSSGRTDATAATLTSAGAGSRFASFYLTPVSSP